MTAGMTRRWFSLATGVFGLISAACRPVEQTATRHVVHRGEQAILQPAGASEAYLGSERESSHAIVAALAAKDPKRLEELVTQGKAISLPTGIRVQVLGESHNERHVKVLEGAQAGREGWVPFEWLAPRP